MTSPSLFIMSEDSEEKNWKNIPIRMRKIAVEALGEKAVRKPGFKFHGSHIFAGKPPWDGIDKSDRVEILESCLELIGENDCRLVYGRCDKVKLQRYSHPMHPHSVAIWLCYERGAAYANRTKSLLNFIAASGTRALSKVAEEVLADYRRIGPPFGTAVNFENVVDNVQFLPSGSSYHLQLCDLWLWTTQRYHTHKPTETDIAELHKVYRGQLFDSGSFPY
jgi:hypothetical protein